MFSEAVSAKLGHVKHFFSTQPINDTKSERNPQYCLTLEVTALSVLSSPLTKTSEGHIPPPDPRILSCHEQTQDIPLAQAFQYKDSHCYPTRRLCYLELKRAAQRRKEKWRKIRRASDPKTSQTVHNRCQICIKIYSHSRWRWVCFLIRTDLEEFSITPLVH